MLCYAMSKPFNSLAYFFFRSGFFLLFSLVCVQDFIYSRCVQWRRWRRFHLCSQWRIYISYSTLVNNRQMGIRAPWLLFFIFFFICGVWIDHLSRCSTMMAHVYYSSFVYVKVDHVYVSTFEVLLSFCSFRRIAFCFFFLLPFYHAMTYFFCSEFFTLIALVVIWFF